MAQYIISYPRSGSTWMRHLIANYIADPVVTPEELKSIIPDGEITTHTQARFIKTHHQYKPSMGKSLYIVRDPRAVAWSYWNYQVYRKQTSLPFDQWLHFFITDGFKFGRWDHHVSSALSTQALVIRYKDLHRNPENVMRMIIYLFLGEEPDDEKIRKSIQASAFKKMKQLYGGNKAIRTGTIDEWKEQMDPYHIDAIQTAFAPVMENLNYAFQ